MSLNLISPTCFTTGVLITNSSTSSGGAPDSIPGFTTVDKVPISAALELNSTDSALQLTRLTTEQMNNIVTPFGGMILYNTDENVFNFYGNGAWAPIGDISGPANSIIGDIPIFGDTEGKVLVDSLVNITRVPPSPSPIPLSDPFLRMRNLDGISFESDANTLDIGDEVFCYFTKNLTGPETKTIFTDSTFDPVSSSPSVLFELNSKVGTFLNVRMNSGEVLNLLPEDGLQVYDITNNQMLFFQNGGWTPLESIVTGATPDATFILASGNVLLPNSVSIGNLSSGLLKNTVDSAVGTLSAALPGTDYYAPGFPTYLIDTSSPDFTTGNLFVGTSSGNSTLTGNQNVGLGINVATSLTNASFNTVVGWNSFLNAQASNNTVVIGNSSAATYNSYDNCIFLGNDSDSTIEGLTNAIAIGSNVTVSESNTLVLGSNCNVAIGQPTAPYTLTLSNIEGTCGIYLPLAENDPVNPSSGGVLHVKKSPLDIEQLYFNGEIVSTTELYTIINDLIGFISLSSFVCKSKVPIIGTIDAPFSISLGNLGPIGTVGLLKNTITPHVVPLLGNVGTPSMASPVKPGEGNTGDYYSPGNPFYMKSTTPITSSNLFIGQENIGFFIGDVSPPNVQNTGVGFGVFQELSVAAANTSFGSFSLRQIKNALYNTACGAGVFENLIGDGINPVTYNTAIGANAGKDSASLTKCTFLGAQSGTTTEGLTNATAIGYNCLVEIGNSVVLGRGANVGIGVVNPLYTLHLENVTSNDPASLLSMCTIAFANTSNAPPLPVAGLGGFLYVQNDQIFFNGSALQGGFTGLPNNLFGGSTGNTTLTGTLNIGVGLTNFTALTSGSRNIVLGAFMNALISGSSNTGIGVGALENLITGENNIAIGDSALFRIGASVSNVAIGVSAGNEWEDYTTCTFIGTGADASVAGLMNATAIGANAVVDTSDSVILGNECNVGIGVSAAPATLSIGNVLNRCFIAIANTLTPVPSADVGDGGVLSVQDDALYFNNQAVALAAPASYVINNETSDAVQVLQALYNPGYFPYILKLEDSASGIIALAQPDIDYITLSYFTTSQGVQDGLIATLEGQFDDPVTFPSVLGGIAIGAAGTAAAAALLAADAISDADEALHKLDEPDVFGSSLHDKVVDAQSTADDAKTKAEDAQSDVDQLEAFVQLEADQGLILKTYDSILSIPGAQYFNFLPLINTSDPVTNTAGYIYSDGDGNLFKDPAAGGGGAPSGAPYVVTTTYAGLTGSIQTLDTLGGPGGLYCAAAGTLSVANPTFITQSEDLVHVPGAQSLGTLSTGLLKNTVTTGVGTLSTALPGTDYYAPGFPTYLFDSEGTTNNFYAGTNVGFPANTGTDNVGVGINVLSLGVDFSRCVGIGINALTLNQANDNIGIGSQALSINETGLQNLGMGTKALSVNISGNNNLGFGYQALLSNIDGQQNISFGTNSSKLSQSGSFNIAIGGEAFGGENNAPIPNSFNIAIGYQACGASVGTLQKNISIGSGTLFSVTGGAFNNVVIGHNAANNSLDAINDCTLLGYNTQSTGSLLFNATAIGANSVINVPNSVILGSECMVGIGTSTPTYSVHIDNITTIDASIFLQEVVTVPTYTVGGGIIYVDGNDLYFNSNGTPVNITNGGGGSGGYKPGEPLYLFSQTINNIGISTVSINNLPNGSNSNLLIGTDALQGGLLTSSVVNNIALGQNSLAQISSGNNNIAIGTDAALGVTSTTINDSIFIGTSSGQNADAVSGLIGIGTSALASCATTSGDIAIGYQAAASYGNNGGNFFNVFLGYQSFHQALQGSANVLLGGHTGSSALQGNNNTFLGFQAGAIYQNYQQSILIGCLSDAYVPVGGDPLTTPALTTGLIAIGESSLCAADSIAIGYGVTNAGNSSISIGGNSSILEGNINSLAIGTSSSVQGNNSTAIGHLAEALADNVLILGAPGTNIGIGTSTPTYDFEVIAQQGMAFQNNNLTNPPVSITKQAYVETPSNSSFVNLFTIPFPASIVLKNFILNINVQISAMDTNTNVVGNNAYAGNVYIDLYNNATGSNGGVFTAIYNVGTARSTPTDHWDGSIAINTTPTELKFDVRSYNGVAPAQWFCTYTSYFFTQQ